MSEKCKLKFQLINICNQIIYNKISCLVSLLGLINFVKIFKMIKSKDSILTYTIRLKFISNNNNDKQCLMIYKPIGKRLSISEVNNNKVIYFENEITLMTKDLIPEELKIGKKIDVIIKSNQKAQLQIIGFADQFTKKTFTKDSIQGNSVFLMIKPGFIENQKFGQIFTMIEKEFQIQRFKMFKLTQANVDQYIVNEKMQSKENNEKTIKYLTSGPCFGFQLKGNNLLVRLRKLMGPQNPIEAKKMEPFTIRSKYGSNIIQNCCYGTKTQREASKQIKFIFSKQVQEQAPRINNSCLCLVKPHIINEKKSGRLITSLLQNGVSVNCMRFQFLKPDLIKRYLDLYKFLPEYEQNIEHFNQGKCIYMQIRIKNSTNQVQQFKKICGPYDPSYAKKINPNSIRGMYGQNRVLNAIHCTQLYEDSQSQIKIIFQC